MLDHRVIDGGSGGAVRHHDTVPGALTLTTVRLELHGRGLGSRHVQGAVDRQLHAIRVQAGPHGIARFELDHHARLDPQKCARRHDDVALHDVWAARRGPGLIDHVPTRYGRVRPGPRPDSQRQQRTSQYGQSMPSPSHVSHRCTPFDSIHAANEVDRRQHQSYCTRVEVFPKSQGHCNGPPAPKWTDSQDRCMALSPGLYFLA